MQLVNYNKAFAVVDTFKTMIFGNIIYRNSKGYHCLDGPAFVDTNSTFKSWWVNGKRHREDGPAVINEDASVEWWYDDEQYKTAELWAIAVMTYQHKATTAEEIQEFLQSILQKLTTDLI